MRALRVIWKRTRTILRKLNLLPCVVVGHVVMDWVIITVAYGKMRYEKTYSLTCTIYIYVPVVCSTTAVL